MASPGASRRRHRSHRSKPNHHCTGPTSHARHMSAEESWPTLHTAPDGNKENLVQGWLDNIEARRSVTVDARPAHSKRTDSKHRSRPQTAQPSPELWIPRALLSLADVGNAGLASRLSSSGREYKRGPSVLEEVSSIIAPDDERDEPATRIDLSPARPALRPASPADESYYERGKKRQHPGLDDSLATRASSSGGHSFEKRPRRKTRGDRYDAVKHGDDYRGRKKRENELDGAGSKRDQKEKAKFDNMTSAREVMGKFVSNSILNNRITVSATLNFPLTVLC